MSFRRTCPECGDTFWHAEHRNYNRQNLTCGKEDCKRRRKSKRQKERRYELRMARLSRKAAREGKRKKSPRGSVKVISRLSAVARRRWEKAKRKAAA